MKLFFRSYLADVHSLVHPHLNSSFCRLCTRFAPPTICLTSFSTLWSSDLSTGAVCQSSPCTCSPTQRPPARKPTYALRCASYLSNPTSFPSKYGCARGQRVLLGETEFCVEIAACLYGGTWLWPRCLVCFAVTKDLKMYQAGKSGGRGVLVAVVAYLHASCASASILASGSIQIQPRKRSASFCSCRCAATLVHKYLPSRIGWCGAQQSITTKGTPYDS